MKQTGSTGNELVNHLPFNEHQNNTVWETNLIEKSNKDESMFLQMGANKSNLQRVTEQEIHTSEVQPDVLNEKIAEVCLLSRGNRTNQVSSVKQIFIACKYTQNMYVFRLPVIWLFFDV